MSDIPEPASPEQEPPPRVSIKIEEFLAAGTMALICLITFANVVVRYLTNASFAFTEEFTVFLMVVLTLAGSAAAFARNRHIRMSYLLDKMPVVRRQRVELVIMLLCALMFAILVWYGARLFWDDWSFNTTSPGIGIPQWIYTLWLPVLSGVILLRIVGRALRLARVARDGAIEDASEDPSRPGAP